MKCRSSLVACAVVASGMGVAIGQVGFQSALELVAVIPPPGMGPSNAGQVILGMADRYVTAIPGDRIARTSNFVDFEPLLLPPGAVGAQLVGVSDDGRHVLGRLAYTTPGMFRTCVWDDEGQPTVVAVGTQQTQQPVAFSSDGGAVLMNCGFASNQRPYLVSSGATTDLRSLSDDPSLPMYAQSMSADGGSFVGTYNGVDSFMWSEASGFVIFDPPFLVSRPQLISLEGRRVVFQQRDERWHATYAQGRWRVMDPFLATRMSNDGRMVFGSSAGRVAVWTETQGIEDLADALMARGVDVGNWTLTSVEYVSPDGRKIVGWGYLPGVSGNRWWVATIVPFAAADMGQAGGLSGSDGQLDNNDFIVFIDRFFSADVRADVGRAGGEGGGDGQFDNNDFIVFISMYFDGEA